MTRLSQWTPFRDRTWPMALPRIWEEMFTTLPQGFDGEKLARWTPAVDVVESADSYTVKAEIPGIDPADIDVTLTGDTMTLRGEKRTEEKREEDNWHVTERSYGSFERTFTFPTPVDAENVKADSENGVLTVTVRKTKADLPRKIKIGKK